MSRIDRVEVHAFQFDVENLSLSTASATLFRPSTAGILVFPLEDLDMSQIVRATKCTLKFATRTRRDVVCRVPDEYACVGIPHRQ